MYIKYYVSETFDKVGFVDMLREQLDVCCGVVADGIILNINEFNAWPAAWLPVWAWLNKADINSKVHTRPATQAEIDACL